MNTLHLLISSPDGNVFDNQALKITLRGIEGDFAVMAGHIPFVTTVKPCICQVELADGSVKEGSTNGGLLTVSDNTVTLISGSFKWK